MKEGDVALATLPQADGHLKNRPVMVLCRMPPFDDLLVCGVSTQIQQQVRGFDETIEPSHADFATSGLKAALSFVWGFFAVLPIHTFLGVIGSISPERHTRLTHKLCEHLRQSQMA